MAAPLIEAGDCTESGNNTASTSWAISRPAQSTGDLIIICLCSDADVTHGTLPGGPNSETAVTITNASGGTSQRISVWYWKATGANSSGTVTVTPSASEQWTACAVRVPAGEFDATTPIGASQTANDTDADNVAQTPAFSAGATDWGGTVCAWIGTDVVAVTAAASGWTLRATEDRGAMGGAFLTRDKYTQGGESIAAADHTIVNETDSNVAFIVRGPGPILDAPMATATAAIPVPTVSVSPTVSAVAATASAGVVTTGAMVAVSAYPPAATASAAIPLHAVAVGGAASPVTVEAQPATANASIVTAGATVAVSAYAPTPIAATAAIPQHTVAISSGIEVQAQPATATAAIPAPAASSAVNILSLIHI